VRSTASIVKLKYEVDTKVPSLIPSTSDFFPSQSCDIVQKCTDSKIHCIYWN